MLWSPWFAVVLAGSWRNISNDGELNDCELKKIKMRKVIKEVNQVIVGDCRRSICGESRSVRSASYPRRQQTLNRIESLSSLIYIF